MKSWKTTFFGIATIATLVIKNIKPQYGALCDQVMTALISVGLIAAKDFNATHSDR